MFHLIPGHVAKKQIQLKNVSIKKSIKSNGFINDLTLPFQSLNDILASRLHAGLMTAVGESCFCQASANQM